MQNYFNHVKNLDFDKKPDYFLVKNLFSNLIGSNQSNNEGDDI